MLIEPLAESDVVRFPLVGSCLLDGDALADFERAGDLEVVDHMAARDDVVSSFVTFGKGDLVTDVGVESDELVVLLWDPIVAIT